MVDITKFGIDAATDPGVTSRVGRFVNKFKRGGEAAEGAGSFKGAGLADDILMQANNPMVVGGVPDSGDFDKAVDASKIAKNRIAGTKASRDKAELDTVLGRDTGAAAVAPETAAVVPEVAAPTNRIKDYLPAEPVVAPVAAAAPVVSSPVVAPKAVVEVAPPAAAAPQPVAMPPAVKGKPVEEVGKAGAVYAALDPVVDIGNKVAGAGGLALAGVEMLAPIVGGGISKLGFAKTGEMFKKPNEYLNPEAEVKAGKYTLGGKLNNGLMLGFGVLSGYGVAKQWSEGMHSLVKMQEAMTGKKVSSPMALLTANDVPEVVKDARKHLLMEHIGRGASSLLNIGLVARAMFRRKSMSMWEFAIPAAAGMAVDIAMGQSALPFFANVQNAHNAGQQLPPQAYAEFLMASSSDLKRRGAIGYQVAAKLGEIYAVQKTAPGDVLKDVEANLQAHKHGHKGKLDGMIDQVLAEAEQKKLAAKQMQDVQGHAKPHNGQQQVSMVEKIGAGGKPREIDVRGKYTKQLKNEVSSTEQGASVIRP